MRKGITILLITVEMQGSQHRATPDQITGYIYSEKNFVFLSLHGKWSEIAVSNHQKQVKPLVVFFLPSKQAFQILVTSRETAILSCDIKSTAAKNRTHFTGQDTLKSLNLE